MNGDSCVFFFFYFRYTFYGMDFILEYAVVIYLII